MAVAAVDSPEPINFHPRRLGHVNLWVGDVKKNTAFYNKVLGFHLEATEPGIKGSFLGNGNTHHDIGTVEITKGEDRLGRDGQVLIPKDGSGKTGLFHLGWEMEDEKVLVDAIYRLRKTDQPIAFFADHQISHSIYIPDPDGNLHEFYADFLKDWRSMFHGEMELITGVWNPGEKPAHSDVRYDPKPRLYGVADAPLHPKYVTHATFTVKDFERSFAFFSETVGLQPIQVDSRRIFATFTGGIGRYDLSIFQAGKGQTVGLHHVGVELENESALAAAKKDLKSRGVKIEKEVDDGSKWSLFILDPDKMRWEFYVDRKRDHVAISKASAATRLFLA